MPAWTCTACRARNGNKRERCAKCDTERPFEPGAKDPVKHELPTCAWETAGKRCLMLATVWIGLQQHRDSQGEPNRPGYCSWHAMGLDSPGLADDFDEFERWQMALIGEGYCTEFLHHRASYVWATLRGEWRPDAERVKAQPCSSPRCWVRSFTEPEPGRRVSPVEAKAAIRRILATLVAKVTV
jgi:hypothetical protein